MRIIKLEKHNKKWSIAFEEEVDLIRKILAGNLIDAYHIGSTAISGIMAKPVIDILLEVRSIDKVDELNQELEGFGYEAQGEYGIKERRFFQKGGDARTHHLHIFESGNTEIERHRLFAEFLNNHPDKAAEYEKLKLKLVNQGKDNPEKYSQGKSAFIQRIDAQAVEWKYN